MATGRTDFWERRVPENDVYRQADPNDPNWRRWTTDEEGRRRQLRRHPDGDCFFLGSHGCTLDLESRPLVCRLYPFAYDERGVHGIDDAYCPVEALVGRDVPGATMLTVLGMVPADGRRWHRMLYDELRQEHDRCASA